LADNERYTQRAVRTLTKKAPDASLQVLDAVGSGNVKK